MFTKKEIAFGIWFVIIFVFLLTKRNVRKALVNFLKVALTKKLIILYIIIYSYIGSIIFLLVKINFWKLDLLKDTCFWLITVPIVSLVKVNENNNKYFREALKECIGLSVFLEYIYSNYTFNIITEFILLPVIIVFSLTADFGDKYGGNDQTKKISNYIVYIILFISIVNSIGLAIKDYENVFSYDSLRNVLLAPILTISYLPLLYLILVYMLYEVLFLRMSLMNNLTKDQKKNEKIKIIKYCKFNTKKIREYKLNIK